LPLKRDEDADEVEPSGAGRGPTEARKRHWT
jgi:hypothetical protein